MAWAETKAAAGTNVHRTRATSQARGEGTASPPWRALCHYAQQLASDCGQLFVGQRRPGRRGRSTRGAGPDRAPPEAGAVGQVVEAATGEGGERAEPVGRGVPLGDQHGGVDDQCGRHGPPYVAGPGGAQGRQRPPVPEQQGDSWRTAQPSPRTASRPATASVPVARRGGWRGPSASRAPARWSPPGPTSAGAGAERPRRRRTSGTAPRAPACRRGARPGRRRRCRSRPCGPASPTRVGRASWWARDVGVVAHPAAVLDQPPDEVDVLADPQVRVEAVGHGRRCGRPGRRWAARPRPPRAGPTPGVSPRASDEAAASYRSNQRGPGRPGDAADLRADEHDRGVGKWRVSRSRSAAVDLDVGVDERDVRRGDGGEPGVAGAGRAEVDAAARPARRRVVARPPRPGRGSCEASSTTTQRSGCSAASARSSWACRSRTGMTTVSSLGATPGTSERSGTPRLVASSRSARWPLAASVTVTPSRRAALRRGRPAASRSAESRRPGAGRRRRGVRRARAGPGTRAAGSSAEAAVGAHDRSVEGGAGGRAAQGDGRGDLLGRDQPADALAARRARSGVVS